jgi:hypothetical protein
LEASYFIFLTTYWDDQIKDDDMVRDEKYRKPGGDHFEHEG